MTTDPAQMPSEKAWDELLKIMPDTGMREVVINNLDDFAKLVLAAQDGGHFKLASVSNIGVADSKARRLTFLRADLVAKPEWMEISSAPRDGTEILLMCTLSLGGGVSVVCNARWVESNHPPYDYFWHDIEGAMSQDAPEYWMPLPPPPALQKGKGTT